MLDKKQIIDNLRSEFMYEQDWMDYAEANQLAHDYYDHYLDLEEDDACEL